MAGVHHLRHGSMWRAPVWLRPRWVTLYCKATLTRRQFLQSTFLYFYICSIMMLKTVFLAGVTGGVTGMPAFLETFFPNVIAAKERASAQVSSPYCQFDDMVLQLWTSSMFLAGAFAGIALAPGQIPTRTPSDNAHMRLPRPAQQAWMLHFQRCPPTFRDK